MFVHVRFAREAVSLSLVARGAGRGGRGRADACFVSALYTPLVRYIFTDGASLRDHPAACAATSDAAAKSLAVPPPPAPPPPVRSSNSLAGCDTDAATQ